MVYLFNLANVDEKQYPPLIGIQTVPRKNQIVLNGVPGTLQFFNPFADRHILELEVAPRNRISKDDQIIDANVSHVAFSSDGLWMGTIDERDDGQFQREVYLKFWSYDINSASFCVNSRIELHHDEKITSLDVSVCDSRSPLAVTCSLDSKFKIWELKTVKDTQFWICRSTGSYKNTPAKHAVFSSDGSVLAVAYDHVVVLFDPLNCTINTVLAYSPKDVEIRQLCFSSVDHYLYVRGSTWIYVWDLLTCKGISY